MYRFTRSGTAQEFEDNSAAEDAYVEVLDKGPLPHSIRFQHRVHAVHAYRHSQCGIKVACVSPGVQGYKTVHARRARTRKGQRHDGAVVDSLVAHTGD